MKIQILKLAALAIPLALTACVETNAPLCDSTHLVDVPGLARSYSTSIMLDPSAGISNMQFTLKHVGLGKYSTDSTSDLITTK